MDGKLFPADFPHELVDSAFVSNGETAWRVPGVSAAIEWLGAHEYAVLGTELLLLQGGAIQSLPIGTSGMGEVHGNTVNREDREAWGGFVSRSVAATLTYLRSFDSKRILEKGELFFNVTWVSEDEFKQLKV